MDYYKEVIPFIKKYMNIVFKAYDGDGAEIVFFNGLSIDWDLNDTDEITKVTIDFKGKTIVGTSATFFEQALVAAKRLAELEYDHLQRRLEIDEEYAYRVEELEELTK